MRGESESEASARVYMERRARMSNRMLVHFICARIDWFYLHGRRPGHLDRCNPERIGLLWEASWNCGVG